MDESLGESAGVSMALSTRDYQIDHDGEGWSAGLAAWSWLLPAEFSPWLTSRFCDLFFIAPDGTVHMLDVGLGTLEQVAATREEFGRRLEDDDNASQWLAIPLVDDLVASGQHLQRGQCYGFKVPPVLGGPYAIENCAVVSIPAYLSACGSIHDQLRGLPDGSPVVLDVDHRPDAEADPARSGILDESGSRSHGARR